MATLNSDAAWKQAQNEEKLPIGIFYQQERPILEDGFPVLKTAPLVKQSPEKRQIKPLLEKMK